MSDPLDLLFAIKAMSTTGGGAERVLATISGALVQRGHRVRLVSFDPPESSSFYPLDPGLGWARLGVGDFSERTGPSIFSRQVSALRKLLVRDRPDVAIGFMHSAYLPLGLARTGLNIPHLASEHTVAEHFRTRPIERAMLEFTPALSDRVSVISEGVKDTFPRRLRRQMVVIPNPVSFPVATQSDLGQHRLPVLLSVGSLTERKDQATLVNAFACVAEDFPQWRLRIVGEGPLRSSLERLVAALGLKAKIELPGATYDIEKEYTRASLFALPSRYESFGLATAEALAHGLPALGFADCPGTSEIILHGRNGRLVTASDSPHERAQALAVELRDLMSSPGERERLGVAGPASVAQFKVDAIVDTWLAQIHELAARGRT